MKDIYKTIILLSTMGLFACNFQTKKQEKKADAGNSTITVNPDSTILEADNSDNSSCMRGAAEPIVKKTVFPKTQFTLQSDSLTGIETVDLANGDQLIIKNWGCEYYVLTFRFETSRFQEDTTNTLFLYKKSALLMSEIYDGIEAPIDIKKGVEHLSKYIEKDQNLILGEEIDFGGNDIRSYLTIDRIEKLTDNKFAIEISFATGPL